MSWTPISARLRWMSDFKISGAVGAQAAPSSLPPDTNS